MTDNERSGKRLRTRIGEPEEFQQRKSFKFYHRDGDEEGREERSFGGIWPFGFPFAECLSCQAVCR